MEAGLLRRPITISSPATTQDAFGQPLQTFNTVCATWASITTITSKEVYALGSGFTSQVTHRITVRYNPDVVIKAGYLITYMSRQFQVQAVSDPDESQRQLNLMVLELSK